MQFGREKVRKRSGSWESPGFKAEHGTAVSLNLPALPLSTVIQSTYIFRPLRGVLENLNLWMLLRVRVNQLALVSSAWPVIISASIV